MPESPDPLVTLGYGRGGPPELDDDWQPRLSRLGVGALLTAVGSSPLLLISVWEAITRLAERIMPSPSGRAAALECMGIQVVLVLLANGTSVVALRRIRRSDGRLTGESIAWIALAISLVSWLFVLFMGVWVMFTV